MTVAGPLIDGHVHVGRVREDKPAMSPEYLLQWMADRGIDRAVLLPLESPEATSRYLTTQTVLDLAESHPDRFIPFCSIDPRMHVTGSDGIAGQLEAYLDAGARGFGELKAGLSVDHEALQRLYELCAAADVPVLIHIDHLRCTDEIGLPNFERMLASYPGLDFIAHAPGWWAHVSANVTAEDLGGYPDDPIATPGRCDALLADYDNCYADLSAGSGWNALTRDPEFGQRFLARHADSLLFGTDHLYPGQDLPQFDLFDRFELSDAAWEAIRFRTLSGVLR